MRRPGERAKAGAGGDTGGKKTSFWAEHRYPASFPTMGYGGHDKVRWIVGGFFAEFRKRMIREGYLTPTKRKGWEPLNPEGYKIVAFEMLDEVGVDVKCGVWPMELERPRRVAGSDDVRRKAGADFDNGEDLRGRHRRRRYRLSGGLRVSVWGAERTSRINPARCATCYATSTSTKPGRGFPKKACEGIGKRKRVPRIST